MVENIDNEFKMISTQISTADFHANNEDKLKLYGLYKQSTVGDNNTSKPFMFQLEALAKWTSWNYYKGINTRDAKNQYITFAKQLLNK